MIRILFFTALFILALLALAFMLAAVWRDPSGRN